MAGNTIGSLSIEVLSNIANAVDGFQKAHAEATKHAQGMQADFNSAMEGMQGAFEKMLAVVGVGISLEGMRELVNLSVEGAEKAQNLSQTLGVTTQTIQTMQYVAALTGTSLDTVSTAFLHMEKTGEAALAGNAQAQEAFRALGISSAQLADMLKHPDDALQTIAASASQFANDGSKNAAMMQVFGRSVGELSPFLEKLGTNYDSLRERAEALGVVLSSQNQSALVAAGEQMSELKEAGVGLANEFTIALLPAITSINEELLALGESGATQNFFSAMGDDVAQTVAIIGRAIDAVKSWQDAFNDMFGSAAPMFQNLTTDAAGLAANFFDTIAKLKGGFEKLCLDIGDGFHAAWLITEDGLATFVNTAMGELVPLVEMLAKIANASGATDTGLALAQTAANWKKAAAGPTEYKAALDELKIDHKNSIDEINNEIQASVDENKTWADQIRLTAGAVQVLSDGFGTFVDSLKAGDIAGNAAKLAAATEMVYTKGEQLIAAGADATKVHEDERVAIDSLTSAMDKADKAHTQYNADVAGTASKTKAAADAIAQISQLIDALGGKMAGPYQKAWSEYSVTLDKIAKDEKALTDAGVPLAQAQQLVAQATDLANAAMREQQDASTALDIVLQHATATLNEQIRISGMSVEQQKIEAETTRLTAEADKALLDIMGPLTEAQQKAYEALGNIATQIVKTDEAMKNSQEVLESYRSIYSSAFDSLADVAGKFFTGQEKGFKGMFDDILNIAKQWIEQMIAQYIKLSVINPILNSLFPSLGAMATSGGGGAGGIIGGLLGSAGGGSSAGGGYSGAGIMDIGKGVWNGFQNGWQSFFGSSGAGWDQISSSGFEEATANNLNMSGVYGTPNVTGGIGYGGYGSALGQGLGIAGGVYAGYNEFQNAGGGAAGLAGGAAYGAGTYFAGAGIATAASTGSLAAGAAAIPVVGWIALAAMLVDKFSGGKLFGTAGVFNGGASSTSFGPDGATVAQGYDTKGQGALFSGANYTYHAVAVDQATQDAADQFEKMLQNGVKTLADSLDAKLADVASGTFVQTTDKKGNVSGSTTTIGGHTYSGESADDFSQREVDESELNVLDEFDSKLNASVDQYRSNVQTLTDVTQALIVGEGMMHDGTKFLALGTDQSLSALLALAAGSQQFGESIGQTLQRIEQSQAQYDQFVAQFKPAGTYVDAFEGSLAQINDTLKQNIAQANALAKAAGAEGASEQDLANIRQTAFEQEQAAVKALQEQAQELAFSLGLSNVGSLDQVNSEIAALQSKQQAASQAMGGMGNSMQEVAQRATDAMNLLIGDLSPLSDQDKLQVALQGLREGTVTKDQVLEIGRRLYASSQAYTDLFNMVKGMPDKTAGSQSSGSPGAQFTGADSAKLAELLKEQSDLQQQAQYQQATQLAQQIAEISEAQGKTWQDVAAGMKVDIPGLEKMLGDSDQQFSDFMTQYQAKLDSDGNNTSMLADILTQGFIDVVNALGGDSSNLHGHSTHGNGASADGSSAPNGVPARGQTGHSGHGGGGRAMTPENVGRAIADALVTAGRNVMPRGLRGSNAFQ